MYRNYLDGVLLGNEPEPEPAHLSRAWLEPPQEVGPWGVTIELGGRAENREGTFDELVTLAQNAGIEEIYVWDVDHSRFEPLGR